jgi:outer membrane protein
MQDENIPAPDNNQADEEVYISSETEQKKPPKKQLFSFYNIVSLVLLIGMIILYILFFTAKKTAEPQVQMVLQKSGSGSTSVVFVNIDSLNEKYEFVKVLKSNLESTGKRLQNEVLTEQANFEKEAADFQKQVANNAISEEKAKMVYEGLMQKQQALLDKKERYTQGIAAQELNLNLQLLDTITNFLKRYNNIYKFDYILTYKTGGDILIANDTLDITSDVIKELNREYKLYKSIDTLVIKKELLEKVTGDKYKIIEKHKNK